MYFPERVNITEVGPRDGLQNESTILSKEKKAELINDCIKAGYKIIEIGSFVHPKAIPALADTEEVFELVNKRDDVEFRALVPNVRGVQRAIDAGIDKVKLTVSASPSHNMSNFNRQPEETVASWEEACKLARNNGLEVSGAISTSFGCPFEGDVPINKVEHIIKELLKLDIKEISLSDTTGMANPKEVYEKCKYVLEQYPEVKWHIHFHNTRDLALANILAAMQAGMTSFDASFSGLGGCPYAPGASGNACSEDIVHMCEEMGIDTGIDLDQAIKIAEKVQRLVGHTTESYMLRAGKASELTTKTPQKQKN